MSENVIPSRADQAYYCLGICIQGAVVFIRTSHGNKSVLGQIARDERGLYGFVHIQWPRLERVGYQYDSRWSLAVEIVVRLSRGTAGEVLYRVATQQDVVTSMMRTLAEKIQVTATRIIDVDTRSLD